MFGDLVMLQRLALGLSFALLTSTALAEPATQVLGNDYVFPNRIEGLPHKLSDFKDLQINRFKTSDGVELAYWEAGQGEPLIFVPGWSANGAEYIKTGSLSRGERIAKYNRLLAIWQEV